MLHLYSASTSGAAPLQVQLTPGSSVTARIVYILASGENTSGAASRPVLTRPSTPGTGTGAVIEKRNPSSATSGSIVLTAFSANPSLPSVSSGSFNLPMRVEWMSEEGFWVLPSASGLLYAAASGGHTWQAELVWEEVL